MKKIFTLLSAVALLFLASPVSAQNWLLSNFEIPAGKTVPEKNGWTSWDAASHAVILNPVKDATNNSNYVFHFINGVQWDVMVNYWIDPKLQTEIYEGIKFKVYITKAGGDDTGTGSKVSFVAAPVKHKENGVDVTDFPEVKITTADEIAKGVWTEVTINFVGLVPDKQHREMRLTLASYGSAAYFDDITLVAKNGVVNQSSIVVTGAANASTITTAGGKLQMSAAILPADATDKTIAWSVSDATIADIDGATGMLTAKKDGVVKVTAKSTDLQKNSLTATKGEIDITISNQTVTGINSTQVLNANVYLADKIIHISSPSTIYSAALYDVAGKEVVRKIVNASATEINVSELKKGIYIVKVKSVDNKLSTIKIVK